MRSYTFHTVDHITGQTHHVDALTVTRSYCMVTVAMAVCNIPRASAAKVLRENRRANLVTIYRDGKLVKAAHP